MNTNAFQMRKIELQMNKAICDCKDWKSENTEVTYSPERDASYVMLHGNHIATIGDTFLELYTCGYKTPTTKSRLNAILKVHGNDARIFQRDFEWFVIDNGNTVPFTEGMVLNWWFTSNISLSQSKPGNDMWQGIMKQNTHTFLD